MQNPELKILTFPEILNSRGWRSMIQMFELKNLEIQDFEASKSWIQAVVLEAQLWAQKW